MKILIAYKEGDDSAAHSNTKLTVPKGWLAGPVQKLLVFVVEQYNSKHADNVLDVSAVHLELEASGSRLGTDDVISAVLEKNDQLLIKPGASKAAGDARQAEIDAAAEVARLAEAKRLDEVGKVKCRNFGCAKLFDPLKNEEGSCKHHVGPPFFHDCSKGWSCCRDQRSAMDWDAFALLPTCASGRHSTEEPYVAPPKPPENVAHKVVAAPLKTIDAYNTSSEGAGAATAAKGFAAQTGDNAKPKVVKYDDGTYRCQNKGCTLKFDSKKNSDSACNFHANAPVFHETYKWWSCCPAQRKMEFDDFLAVKGCRRGPHWNGEGDAPAGADAATVDDAATADGEIEAGEDGFDLG